MSLYYARNGAPMTLEEWVAEFKPDRQAVAKTDVGDAHVSTVWLGLDQSFGEGPPLIFETMVFGHPEFDEYQWRYSTEEQAIAHHDQVVAALRDGQKPPDFEPHPISDETEARNA